MFGDWGYMSPWALLTLSVAAGSAVVYGKQRLVVVRVGNKIRFGLFPGHKSPEPSTLLAHNREFVFTEPKTFQPRVS